MSFFDRFKKSVSEAGALAKVTVEVNRLKLQVSSKKKEIANLYETIGETVFQTFTENGGDISRANVEEHCRAIIGLQKEIGEIALKIQELSNEKTCSCGHTVSLDAVYCPKCGSRFEEKPAAESEAAAGQAEPDVPTAAANEAEPGETTPESAERTQESYAPPADPDGQALQPAEPASAPDERPSASAAPSQAEPPPSAPAGTCPSCSRETEPDAKFCGHCGQQLA